MAKRISAWRVGMALAAWSMASAATPVVITNVNLVTMVDDSVLRNHAVVIDGERIEWLGPKDTLPTTDDDRVVIDAAGAYLLPGLIDAHVHLNDPAEYPLYLGAGVTTVVELGGPDHRHWRRALSQGESAGPRLLTCGPTVAADSAEAAAEVVARHAAAGFDCIKIYDDIAAEVFAALVTAAERVELPSFGHIPRNLAWSDMLEAAPDAVAHAEEFLYSPCCSPQDLERIIDTMGERDIALVTTLTTYDNIIEQVADLELFLARQPEAYYPPVNFRAWQRPYNRYADFNERAPIKMRALFGFQQALIRRLHEGGVAIVMGTDAGNTGTYPGISAAEELAWLVDAGLSPFAALESATGAAARLIGKGDRLGRIAVGRVADLVLLAGNPLSDISNVRFVRGVMLGGRWFDGDALRRMRDQAAADLKTERELVRRLETDGVEAALSWLAAQDTELRLLALNELGYQELRIAQDAAAALRLFEANVRMHPEHWIAHASLAEGLLETGNRAAAVKAAERALELAPEDSLARHEIEALGLSAGDD